VDLRTKSKADKFAVWTKDGITVELTICIEYRIGNPQEVEPDSQLIYPYDAEAVKKAVERYSLRWPDSIKEPGEFTWEDAAWGQVTGIVPDYIGSRFLDDILVADRRGGQILSPNATDEIFERLNKATNIFGVHITDFQILSIEVPPEVEKYYVQYWEAERQSLATIMEGKAKAFNIRTREKVRADAQHDLIMSIADGLQRSKGELYAEPLLLSLSGLLDNSLNDPLMRSYLAKGTLDTLEQIRKILDLPRLPESSDENNGH
jgi:regulator of protease activity HflC (stomatin/prohibitin superfamily)